MGPSIVEWKKAVAKLGVKKHQCLGASPLPSAGDRKFQGRLGAGEQRALFPLTLEGCCGTRWRVVVLESEKPVKVFCKTESGSEICWDKETEKHRIRWFVFGGRFPEI